MCCVAFARCLCASSACASGRGAPCNADRSSCCCCRRLSIFTHPHASNTHTQNNKNNQKTPRQLATQIVGSLLALEALDEDEDIRLYINSPGGQPYSVIGVVDTLRSIKPDVMTVGLGAVYSYSSLLLAAGAKGKRYAMKNTRLMMTQPQGGSQGDMYAINATVKELNAIYQLFAKYYIDVTGLDGTAVEHATCRDTFMTPEEGVQVVLCFFCCCFCLCVCFLPPRNPAPCTPPIRIK